MPGVCHGLGFCLRHGLALPDKKEGEKLCVCVHVSGEGTFMRVQVLWKSEAFDPLELE